MAAARPVSVLTAINHSAMKAFAFASGCAGILAGENGVMTAQCAEVVYTRVQGALEKAAGFGRG